jgi:hypothetical protein
MPVAEKESELKTDPRWQLIEKVTASPSFQKSARIRELLRFMAERTLHGHVQDLTEHNIGSTVFGKPQDYNVVEDSSVRVQVRQLRLKLHEYFDGEGREEAWVVEIPKGAYTTVFRNVESRAATKPTQESAGLQSRLVLRLLPWILAALFFSSTAALWFSRPKPAVAPAPPWPLAALFAPGGQSVRVVVADANYGMMRLVDQRPVTLERYLSPSYRSGEDLLAPHPTEREARLMKYLNGALLTSYADLVVVDTLMRLSGHARNDFSIVSARDLNPRDLEDGSFVFVGSPSSNPWVSYFENRLNFQEREGGIVGEGPKFFLNLHPQPGEQGKYQGLTFTGSSGEDYATIALLPLPSGHGNVLILQGLQQEGTEAAGLFLADADNRKTLQKALGIIGTPAQPVYFEALIRNQAIAGAPSATSIVATRLIRP